MTGMGGRGLLAVELVASDGPWRDDDPVIARWGFDPPLEHDAGYAEIVALIRIYGVRADRRLRETWTKPLDVLRETTS